LLKESLSKVFWDSIDPVRLDGMEIALELEACLEAIVPDREPRHRKARALQRNQAGGCAARRLRAQ